MTQSRRSKFKGPHTLRWPRVAAFATAFAAVLGPNAAAQEAEEGETIRRRLEFFYEQRAYPFAQIPTGALQRAMLQLEQRWPGTLGTGRGAAAQAAGDPAAWLSIGPILISGEDAGRLTAIALHPTDPDVLYVGGAQGGVWKSIDGGASWTAQTDRECSLAMGSLALDPVDPEIVYAGTGEMHFSGDSYYGCGVLRSTDGGATWAQLGGDLFDTNSGGATISKLLVDPVTAGSTTSTTLYAATNFGLYRSIDSGASWTRLMTGIFTELIRDPSNLDVLYAAIGAPSGNTTNGVYKSTDAGATWTRQASGFATSDVGRIQLALAPSRPQTVYASVQNAFGGGSDDGELLGIWRTVDGGVNWVELPATNASCGTQCWYDQVLAVHPTDPNTIYFGGVALYKSTDGGFNFSNVLRNIHVDQHAIVIDPRDPQRVYAGNDGGIFRTDDGAASWVSLNNNLELTQFYGGFSLHPTQSSIALGGTQDNGTVEFAGEPSWDRVLGADGGFTAIDYENPSVMYAETQWTQNSSFAGPRRRDGAGSFVRRVSGINTGDRALFIPPLVIDPTTPTTLYFGTFRLYRTTNRGDLWSIVSPSLTRTGSGRVSAIAPARSEPDVIYVGTSDGYIQVTTNGGASWSPRIAGLPDRYVTDIAVDAADATTAIATVSGFGTGHVFRTVDAGATWQDISGNLPDVPVNAVLLSQALPGEIHIGTDLGVFRSIDAGASWTPLDNGLPNVAVFDLVYSPVTGRLAAATHGRGVFTFAPVIAATVTIVSDSLHFDALGDSVRLSGAATAPDGQPIPDPVFTWHSLDPSIATVDGTGLVRSVGNGATRVVASIAGAADTLGVGVRQVVVGLIGPPARDSIVTNELKPLPAVAFDANDRPVTDAPLVWTSSNPAAVTVDGEGRILGVAVGTAVVRVEIVGLSDSSVVRVETPATLDIGAAAITTDAVPRSSAGTRIELLSLTLDVDGIEPVRLSRLGFDVRGDDLEARVEVIRDIDGDGRFGTADVIVVSTSAQLRPGQTRRVIVQPNLEVPVIGVVDLLIALRMGGGAPNGATFSATFLPSETRSLGVRSAAQDRIDQPAAPVASADVQSTVLAGQDAFGVSENPVRSQQVTFSYSVGASPARAAVYTIAGRLVADLTRRIEQDRIIWDLTNDEGGRVQPGVYLVVFEVDGQLFREKLIVLRPVPERVPSVTPTSPQRMASQRSGARRPSEPPWRDTSTSLARRDGSAPRRSRARPSG